MQLTVEESLAQTLQQLAREDGVSPEKLLEKLIKHEDSERHVVWTKGSFVRVKCSRDTCTETRPKPHNYNEG